MNVGFGSLFGTWKRFSPSSLILTPVRTKYKLKTRKACAKRFSLKPIRGTRTHLHLNPKQNKGTQTVIENQEVRWHFKKMLPYYNK